MFLPRPLRSHRLSRCRLSSAVTLLLGALLFSVCPAHAQKQDENTLDRILHPDRTMKFDAADKKFGVASSVGGKQATVKSYSFGSKGSVFNGEGKFRTKNFDNPKDGGFRTQNYLTKTSQLSMRNSFAQADQTFAVKSMDVREAPGTNKSAQVKEFSAANRAFTQRGKRQDFLDEHTHDAKNLTSDQVRDILNKGPAGKPGTLLEPVAPTVR